MAVQGRFLHKELRASPWKILSSFQAKILILLQPLFSGLFKSIICRVCEKKIFIA